MNIGIVKISLILLMMMIIIIIIKVRGEGRAEDKSSNLTGLNLIYPGLLVFYVEVGQNQKLSNLELGTWHVYSSL